MSNPFFHPPVQCLFVAAQDSADLDQGVPLLCHVSHSDQLQILDFSNRARNNFRAGWLSASH